MTARRVSADSGLADESECAPMPIVFDMAARVPVSLEEFDLVGVRKRVGCA